jgi:hypothetical protein
MHFQAGEWNIATEREREFVTSNDKPRIVAYRYNIESLNCHTALALLPTIANYRL